MNKRLHNIQLLRAYAFLLVLGFHLDLPYFDYGYVGVDIFFVISGYLMSLIYPNLKTFTKIKAFYSKRFFRLAPSFIIIQFVCIFAFWGRLLPFERQIFQEQLLASNLFFSNMLFWSQDQYFGSGMLRPLLHTWSLSVEIQFYLMFPLILKLLQKYRSLFYFFYFLSFFSFIALSSVSPKTAFFVMPFRLWEFMSGVILGSLVVKVGRRTLKHYVSISLALVSSFLVLLYIFSSSQNSFIPNVASVILALSLIYFEAPNSSSQKHSFWMKIGDRSYVLYLIHFPLIIWMNTKPFEGNVLGLNSGLKYFLFFILLFSSAELIHRKFEFVWVRKAPSLQKSTLSFCSLIFFSILLSMGSLNAIASSKLEVRISDAYFNRSDFRCGLLSRVTLVQLVNETFKYCKLASSDGDTRFLLIGNSHADAIKETVSFAVEEVGGDLFMVQENMNINSQNVSTILSIVDEIHPNVIILHASHGTFEFSSLSQFFFSMQHRGIRIVFVESVPTYEFNILRYVLSTNSRVVNLSRDYFEFEYESEISRIKSLLPSKLSMYVPTIDVFCPDLCLVADSNLAPYYFDSNHLTLSGAKLLLPRLTKALFAQVRSSE